MKLKKLLPQYLSLRIKFLISLTGIIVVTVLVSLAFVQNHVKIQIERSIKDGLRQTRNVFHNFQEERYGYLISQSRVIAEDPKFFASIADLDAATAYHEAVNFQQIVKADLFMVTDGKENLLIEVGEPNKKAIEKSYLSLVRQALEGNIASGLLEKKNRIYQAVSVPVRVRGEIFASLTIGYLIDNLLAADMVLADGRFVTVNDEENKDVFWAIRGGGGNFGVVTSFLFRLHPIYTEYAGPMLWELNHTTELMKWYREFITQAPEDISGFFAFLVVPPVPPFPEHLHNKTMCGVVWCYSGLMEKAEEAFKPIRSFLLPALDLVGPMPHPVVQSMFDALYPPGLQWYWRADFVNELSDDAIAHHMKYASKIPSMHSTMHLYPINGAAHRVSNSDTAWSYRNATWAQVIIGVDPDPANNERIISWTKEYWEALHPYSAGGAYVNFMMEEGEDRIKATYRDNYDRLVEVKNKYDPTNLFRVNQNIKPTV